LKTSRGLRRAGRDIPGNRDIPAVRLTLENELGGTVSRRLAARLLGVSHTALDRWIKAGDLPVVFSSSGRFDVPVPALLGLYETTRAEHSDRDRNPLAPTMSRQREAARRLRVEEQVVWCPPERFASTALCRAVPVEGSRSRCLLTPMARPAQRAGGSVRSELEVGVNRSP
jgi:hypothetical protein